MILIFILINFFQLVYEFFLRFLESPDFQPTIGNPSHIYYIYSYLIEERGGSITTFIVRISTILKQICESKHISNKRKKKCHSFYNSNKIELHTEFLKKDNTLMTIHSSTDKISTICHNCKKTGHIGNHWV